MPKQRKVLRTELHNLHTQRDSLTTKLKLNTTKNDEKESIKTKIKEIDILINEKQLDVAKLKVSAPTVSKEPTPHIQEEKDWIVIPSQPKQVDSKESLSTDLLDYLNRVDQQQKTADATAMAFLRAEYTDQQITQAIELGRQKLQNDITLANALSTANLTEKAKKLVEKLNKIASESPMVAACWATKTEVTSDEKQNQPTQEQIKTEKTLDNALVAATQLSGKFKDNNTVKAKLEKQGSADASAGLLVMVATEKETYVLMSAQSRRGATSLVLPNGKVEPGFTSYETAVLETREESHLGAIRQNPLQQIDSIATAKMLREEKPFIRSTHYDKLKNGEFGYVTVKQILTLEMADAELKAALRDARGSIARINKLVDGNLLDGVVNKRGWCQPQEARRATIINQLTANFSALLELNCFSFLEKNSLKNLGATIDGNLEKIGNILLQYTEATTVVVVPASTYLQAKDGQLITACTDAGEVQLPISSFAIKDRSQINGFRKAVEDALFQCEQQRKARAATKPAFQIALFSSNYYSSSSSAAVTASNTHTSSPEVVRGCRF